MEYLHGYTTKEQARLYRQAEFMEDWIYEHVRFPRESHIVEIGCGVGAQTQILLRRFPTLKINGIDISSQQLAAAKKHLKGHIQARQVRLHKANASKLPFAKNKFDGAFICWFLEHVPKPLEVLKEAHRVLKPGALIYATEVMHSSLFVEPYSPATLNYWFQLNDYQWSIKGHPFIGAELGNLLQAAKFKDIELEVKNLHFDNRNPEERQRFHQDFSEMLISAAPNLLKEGRVDEKLIAEMKRELKRAAASKKSVFYYNFMQAKAKR